MRKLKKDLVPGKLWDKKDSTNERLVWCLMMLVSPPPLTQTTAYPASLMFTLIDECLASAINKNRAIMDDRRNGQLSRYVDLDELLCIVRLYRPGPGPKLLLAELLKVTKSKHFQYVRDDTKPDDLTLEGVGSDGGMVPLLLDFIECYESYTTVDNKDTKVALERFDRVEFSVDAFWGRLYHINMLFFHQKSLQRITSSALSSWPRETSPNSWLGEKKDEGE